MRVITFSRFFPANHPRKGQPTFFVEKIWDSIYLMGDNADWLQGKFELRELFDLGRHGEYGEKNHTIRAGNRWKVGDKFSPRVWGGKPYASKQIEFAPPIEIKKIWEIQIEGYVIHIDKFLFCRFPKHAFELAKNDGLSVNDFWDWFPYQPGKVFKGQILCWNESVDYLTALQNRLVTVQECDTSKA